MSEISVILVDDHAIVRHGLRSYFELVDDIDVVGEGESGADAVRLATELEPDVVLMDMVMPDMDGIGATRAIIDAQPGARVLILSSFGEEAKVMPALEAGAAGYLLKDVAPDELAEAIRDVHAGRSRLHPEVTSIVMGRVKRSAAGAPGSAADELTSREKDVLRQLARGLSNDEVSVELSISSLTVKTHVSNILSKLGLADRTQAAIFAIRHGIAPLDPE